MLYFEGQKYQRQGTGHQPIHRSRSDIKHFMEIFLSKVENLQRILKYKTLSRRSKLLLSLGTWCFEASVLRKCTLGAPYLVDLVRASLLDQYVRLMQGL